MKTTSKSSKTAVLFALSIATKQALAQGGEWMDTFERLDDAVMLYDFCEMLYDFSSWTSKYVGNFSSWTKTFASDYPDLTEDDIIKNRIGGRNNTDDLNLDDDLHDLKSSIDAFYDENGGHDDHSELTVNVINFVTNSTANHVNETSSSEHVLSKFMNDTAMRSLADSDGFKQFKDDIDIGWVNSTTLSWRKKQIVTT